MSTPRGLVRKLPGVLDKNVVAQFDNIISAARKFPFLGILDSDPDTTGWGVKDLCFWINNSTNTACVIKFWDGDEVKTISTA